MLTTPEHRAEAIESTTAKLQRNGYSEEWQDSVQKGKLSKLLKKNRAPKLSNLILKLPFVTDSFNRQKRSLLEKKTTSTPAQ